MTYQKSKSDFNIVHESGSLNFTGTELKIISELGNGNCTITNLAKNLNISVSQVYRVVQKLNENGILNMSKGALEPEMKTHVNMLLKLLSRAKNLSTPLSGTGLQIFTTLICPKTIKEIENETGLHKTTILKKINQGRKMSLLLIKDKKYRINEKIWLDAKEFFIELKKYEESVDNRVPVNSEIYFKSYKEIIFSSKEELDAIKTAFSAYGKYGIRLLLTTNYYYLPKRKLSKEKIFTHSIHIADKSKDTQHMIFVALFYIKYKKELLHINHKMIDDLNQIFSGENIPNYPTLLEIKDRAKVYDIKV